MVIILSLRNLLKNNKEARRIFGEKELKIVIKQLEGITLTQSEKNRLSRDIRPKLQFIKELIPFDKEFELKKGQHYQGYIGMAVSAILQDELAKNVLAILLFGSRAGGIVSIRSDVDVCVVLNKEISSQETTKFRLRILRDLPDKFDVQIFNVMPQKIKRAIAANHRILYRSSEFDNLDFSIRYLKDDDYLIRRRMMQASP
ncbi:MAG TPA: nucleotidyltransferase domain-containing protein [Candidatus Nanoarchaeia archaeon]|nr:nucleotidyltransferase domain-containing protein [Candidatus Nanoarchaeia archaeon]